MGRDRLALGCLLASFRGPDAPDWLLRRIEAGLGGVCLFGDNITSRTQVAELTARLREARPDLVIATDEEGGDVTRLEMATGSSYPGNAALGAVDDVALTGQVATSIGVGLAAAGIDLDLAPCVDVNSNPANPVIGVRSFGADPALVARHGVAFVRGLHAAGVGACAKHFPGHGDTAVDSHLALPVLDAPVELLARRELVPFAAVVAAGVDAVMTSHVVVRALDGEPATLSASVLGGLLRGELGFDGVIVTDALDMRGASGNRTIGEAAVLSLLAGADLLCLGARQDEELLDAVVDAIADAGAPDVEAALAAAAARIAAFHGRAVTAELVSVQDGGIGRVAAARAIRVAGAPLPSLRGARVVELRPIPGMAAGDVPWSVAAVLVDRDPTIAPIRLGAGDATDDALVAAAGHPLVVVVRDAHRHAWQGELLSRLLGARPDAVVVDLGWPPPGRPPAATVVTTYGASRASAEAVADLLLREDSLCG